MNEEFTPISFLMLVQKAKLRAAAAPILLVLIGLGLSVYTPFLYAKYISLFGLLLYFITISRFRIRKRISSEIEMQTIYSPINGTISDTYENDAKITITIRKGFFQPAEIRCPSADKNVEVSFEKGKITWFERSTAQPKKMNGIVPVSAICKCSFPKEYKLQVQKGNKVVAGESKIAAKV